ncbi:hypothetical protein [Vibrio panuliri]|uniref:Capsid assembly protein n=1 Tax=Vibrio panuliri TaxID=1381081 RepID=A0ABX3FGI4_9VIBR|nr:hypothetical protein [Vibrio panuliri]KAB1460888.1 hypothetical protein F7O85_00495 [Vibrio panuliri]OLQ91641.1 hypothetical protein BIY20_09570 [Vibrio panuliri]
MEQAENTPQLTHEQQMLQAASEVEVASDNYDIDTTVESVSNENQLSIESATKLVSGSESDINSDTESDTTSTEKVLEEYQKTIEKESELNQKDSESVSNESQNDTVDEEKEALKQQVRTLYNQDLEKSVYEVYGGKESFDQVAEWAKENIPENVLNGYNDMIAEGAPKEAVLFFAQAFKAIHDTQFIQEPQLVHSGAAAVEQGYSTDTDLFAAMADPRYQRTDAVGDAYRAEVLRKMNTGATNPLGNVEVISYG